MPNDSLQVQHARDFLGSCGWLANQPGDFRQQVLSGCRLRVVEKGACVYRIGGPPDGLYGAASGQLAVEIAPHEQGPNFAHSFLPGTWFGEAALIGECPRLVTIVAVKQSTCLFLSRSEIEKISKADTNTWRYIAQILLANFRTALGAFDDLTLRRPEQRIAASLLRLGGIRDDGQIEEGPLEIEIEVTQNELAQISNLSRTTIGEHLDRLQKAGLIKRTYGKIRFLDAVAFRKIISSPD